MAIKLIMKGFFRTLKGVSAETTETLLDLPPEGLIYYIIVYMI